MDARTAENASENAAPSLKDREALLDAMLQIAAETGWTDAGLRRAQAETGMSDGRVQLATPHGVSDLIDALFARAAHAAAGRLTAGETAGLKVREKVRAGVKAFLAVLEPHKPAVKRALANPAGLVPGPKGVWSGADAIWSALGDKSTDYNWYTKRGILSGVIGSTLACWAGTDDEAVIDAFLDRRIENVMEFEKTKKKVQDAVKSWPDPLDFILGKKQGGV